MTALHPELHPELSGSTQEGRHNAPNTPGADLHHQNAEYPDTHCHTYPVAHPDAENAHMFASGDATRCHVSASESAPARFLDWLYDDGCGYLEVVAGQPRPTDPEKIDLVMKTRRFLYRDPERPDLRDLAISYIAQLADQYGNVYISCRLYTRAAKDQNARSEAFALPSKIIFIDDAMEEPYLRPSLTVQTSPDSRHAYYKADAPTTKDDARRAAKFLDGDPSGVDLTQLVRVPGTFNTKNGKRFPVVIEDVGPTYPLDTLRARFPQVEVERGSGSATIEALDWPEVEAHLSNINALLGSARAQLIKAETQTGRILAGELLTIAGDGSRSMNTFVVMYGFYLRGFADDEIAAIGFHLNRQWGVERDKGTAWCKLDVARILAKCHTKMPGVKQSPTRYHATHAAESITELRPISRARADRPQRFTWAALFTQYQERPELCNLKRKARAAALGISTATLDRLEKELRTCDPPLIAVETDPQRQGSRVILRGVINITPAEVLSAAPTPDADEPPNIRSESGQIAIDAPQCIGGTHPPPDTPGPAPRPASAAELRRWCVDALDRLADAGARPSFARVRKYVLCDADGRPVNLATLKAVYANEMDRRRWARQDAREARKAAALPSGALRKRSQNIASQAAAMHRKADPRAPIWTRRAGIYAAEEARRDAAAEQLDAERFRDDLGYSAAQQAELLDQVDRVVRRRPARTPVAARPAGGSSAAGVFPPSGNSPIEPSASVGTPSSLLAGIRRYHAAHAAGGD